MDRQTFILDFDGTIADTLHHLVKISNRLSTEYGFRAIRTEDIDILKDKTSLEIIQYLQIPLVKVPILAARVRRELSRDIAAIPPASGLLDNIRKLKMRDHQLGILSSNSFDNISAFLKKNSFDVFDFVHATTTIWGKNIQLARLMDEKRLKKENVWYIGDEVRDVWAAKKAGIKSVAVCWGYNSYKALRKAQPDHILRSPCELADLIQY